MSQSQRPSNWAAIFGKWSFNGDQVTYLGPDDDRPESSPVGLCVTDVQLREGKISCRTKMSDENVEGKILLAYRSPNDKYVIAGLRGWNRAYTIGEWDPTRGWIGLAVAGNSQNLAVDRWYEQTVILRGQTLQVTVDNVRVLQHTVNNPIMPGQVGLFAWGRTRVEFENYTVNREAATAFVVMKFAEPYHQLYKEVIVPVVESFGLRAYHVGEVFGPGNILQDIVQGIAEAQVVIAEITPINQNVFYELGYAHALGKPTILLAERGTQLPFDVSGYRTLFYDNSIGGKKQVEEGLRKHLNAILME